MTEAEKIVANAESLGWQCYGNYGDTPEQKVKRRWWDAEDPSELQESPPPLPPENG